MLPVHPGRRCHCGPRRGEGNPTRRAGQQAATAQPATQILQSQQLMTAAITVAKPPDNARPGMTVVECRPSARTALDDSRQPAHSYGSEGRAAARRGCRPGPRDVWAVAPAVSTPHCLRGTRQGSSLRQRGRTPHPCDRRAISVQLAPATSGRSRSLADTPTRRSGHVEGRSRTDSQADSAGSIPVTRSDQKHAASALTSEYIP